MTRTIRETRATDMAEIMRVIEAAKGIMRDSGNRNQWAWLSVGGSNCI